MVGLHGMHRLLGKNAVGTVKERETAASVIMSANYRQNRSRTFLQFERSETLNLGGEIT